MPEIYWYFLKVVLISGILYGYYHIALRDRIFHHWNRYYLLSSVAVSLLLPLIRIPLSSGNDGIITVLNSVTLQDAVIINSTAPTSGIVGMENFVLLAYIIISLTILTGFIRTFFRLQKIKQKFPAIRMQNILFYNTDAAGTPFSFFYSLFWNRAIELDSDNGQQIFHHELTHIREKHSLDKVFMQIILLFAWINPFFWLIKRELNLVHEYIADNQAVRDQDPVSFARMLLAVASPAQPFSITNYFFHSPIKRRLIMLTKNKNKRLTYFTRLLVLPLVAFLFASFALESCERPGDTLVKQNQAPTEAKIIPPVDQIQDLRVVHTKDGKTFVSIKDKNGKIEKLNLAEAKQRGLDIPPPPPPPMSKDDRVFTQVEHEASFVGGQKAWATYISGVIKKHLDELTEKDYGTVQVKFIVDKRGFVKNVAATTMQGTKLAELTVEAIKKGPRWKPAEQNGLTVSAYRIQPVTLQSPGK